jgi:type IV pilus assembly protein PilY1
MSIRRKRITWLAAGMLWALTSGLPASADDTELFVGDATLYPQSLPNILFILDTSGSMTTPVLTQGTYSPAVVYPGTCVSNRIYWRRGTGNPPDCATTRWFDATAFVCDAATKAFALAGRHTDRMAQYDPNSDDRWERLSSGLKSRLVECEDDGGTHGDGSDPTKVWAQNGDDTALWTNNSDNEVAWGNSPTDRAYTTYDANYLNWYNGPTGVIQTRTEIMKEVANATLASVNGVKVGLMRFNNSEGGPVVHAMEDIATARGPMTTTINGLPASGWTPLSETLYEAGLYYMGGNVDYGNANDPATSIANSRTPLDSNIYLSPIEFGCQKNFVVLLTDGAPTQDTGAQSKIELLKGGTCDGGTGDGACLDDMAEFMFNTDLRTDLPGIQNVITYTIGFAVDLPILASTAAKGGGAYFTADNTAQLSTALTSIVTSILDTQTTFTAPAVSVNSFNRTRNLNDLFITVFQATGNIHWPGNLKKYRLKGTDIVDANNVLAVDPSSGFFADGARSFWSPSVDGSDVVAGGAANQIPPPNTRNLYTYLGNSAGPIKATGNVIASGNGALDNTILGLGQPGDPTRTEVLDFARGVDVTDEDQDGDVLEARNVMGDPLHATPKSVIYGPTLTDAVVFFATNDGYLHAIDPDTGVEKWAFIPSDFLPSLVDLYENESSPNKHYGIDGDIIIQTKANNDGVIDATAGEKVFLYFGMRRGGNVYHALDVTDPNSPQFMWRLDASTLPNVGQTWSAPVPTRINIATPNLDSDKMVLVVGGGYDPTQDNLTPSTDSSGNAIYILDSKDGDLLWYATQTGSPYKNNSDMQYSMPAEIKVVDIDGDRFADRLFAADMGGQVWRFDVINGQAPASLINGGVIAQLGASTGATSSAEARRMYYAPDVALIRDDDHNFIHVGVGSGHRARPNSVFTRDRFYAIRSYEPFQAKSQLFYDAITPIVEADLVDITPSNAAVVPIGSAGWRLELNDGGWIGEKVLAEARTFDNKVFFTTFTPGAGATANNCEPALGITKLYIVDIFNGSAVNNLDGVGDLTNLTESDRFVTTTGSISSEVIFLFPSPDDPANCIGDACTPPPIACVGLFCFPPGFPNEPTRTVWSEEDTQ